jgi:hypothetical protein
MVKTFWAVRWDRKAARGYGATPGIITVEASPENIYKVNCKCKAHKGWHWISSLAIFESKKEAVAYRNGNKDFVVQSLTVGWTEKV